jgi:hypothetical protein
MKSSSCGLKKSVKFKVALKLKLGLQPDGRNSVCKPPIGSRKKRKMPGPETAVQEA